MSVTFALDPDHPPLTVARVSDQIDELPGVARLGVASSVA